MRIWVSRSEPGASRQAAALRNAGYDVVTAPVIEIEATEAARPAAEAAFQHVIFLSEQAVRFGGPFDYCAGASVHAVGQRTAAALRAQGIRAEVPNRASSDGLLEHLSNDRLADTTCLIVAGLGGRKTLAESLKTQGVRLTELLCYRRVDATVDPTLLAGVTHILVASQDGFKAVARLWCSSGADADVKVIVASDRIALIGPELGLANLQIAAGAAEEDWIAALENRNA